MYNAFGGTTAFHQKRGTIARGGFFDNNTACIVGRGEEEQIANTEKGAQVFAVADGAGKDDFISQSAIVRIRFNFRCIIPFADDKCTEVLPAFVQVGSLAVTAT